MIILTEDIMVQSHKIKSLILITNSK